MDEIGVWCEVVRAMLPQRYAVRITWEDRALIVTSPEEERLVWIGEHELSGLSPTRAIHLIEAKMKRPDSRLAARFDPQLAV